MSEITTDRRYCEIKEMIVEERREVKMCEFLDYLLNEGREEGLKEGIKEGKKDVVQILLKEGRLQIEDAARLLGMPEEDVREKLYTA